MAGILLAILLILLGIGWLGIWSAPSIVLGILAIIAWILMLVGR